MRRAGAAGAALLLAATACGGAQGPPRRSVVLVVVDTLRADRAASPRTAPRLDAFAREAVVFERARSTAPWTKSSVASLLTGLDPRAAGVLAHTDALSDAHRTLAEAFREAGWQTLAVQSNLYLVGAYGFSQGFDSYADELPPPPEEGRARADGPRVTMATHDRSTGARVNAVALEDLDALDPARPFFAWIHHYEPHHKYLRDELVPADGLGLPAERRDALARAKMDELIAATPELAPGDVRYLAARYDSEVLYQDRLLEELFAALRARGLLDGAVVAVTSDHGEEFLEHGSLSHRNDSLADELLRVPLLLRAPGLAPRRVGADVSLRDLGRTLLDLAGLRGTDFPGSSLVPLARGETGGAGPVVAHGMLPEREGAARSERDALVSGRWKLVRDLEAGTSALFDLDADPGELRDLAPTQPARVGDLERALSAFLARDMARGAVGPESPEAARERARFLEEHRAEIQHLGYAGAPPPTPADPRGREEAPPAREGR